LDDSCSVVRSLAPRSGHVVHAWRIHSHPSSRSFGHLRNQFDSGSPADGLEAKRRNMKPIILVGILLVVLGGLALAYQGFTYTHQERVLDVGPIHATREDRERVSESHCWLLGARKVPNRKVWEVIRMRVRATHRPLETQTS
jgi:hypothetical protein